MVVDEFRAVVGIDSPHRKGQLGADVLEGLLYEGLALPHHRAGLGPGGVDVGEGQGVDELPIGPISRVGDKVDLSKAWDGCFPALSLDGDLVLQ
jgi:hypothetical protein